MGDGLWKGDKHLSAIIKYTNRAPGRIVAGNGITEMEPANIQTFCNRRARPRRNACALDGDEFVRRIGP